MLSYNQTAGLLSESQTHPWTACRSRCHRVHVASMPPRATAPDLFVIMGPSGCGKSTVGQLLAQQLGCPFYDGDDYHPAANIRKMQSGIPLTDDDRWPWLQRLTQLLAEHVASGTPVVLACSALKPAYRQLLRGACQKQPQQQQQQALQHCQHDDQQAGQHAVAEQQQEQQQQQPHVDARLTQPAAVLGQQPMPPSCEGQHRQHPDCIAFVLVNPPRDVLLARLQARAAAGTHFMPASLLDSQLAQLDVPDPSELYMCFGSHIDSDNCSWDGPAATLEAPTTAAPLPGSQFPGTQEIVKSILAKRHGGAAKLN